MSRASSAHLQEDTWPLTYLQIDGTICCLCTTVSSWRWALDARNM